MRKRVIAVGMLFASLLFVSCGFHEGRETAAVSEEEDPEAADIPNAGNTEDNTVPGKAEDAVPEGEAVCGEAEPEFQGADIPEDEGAERKQKIDLMDYADLPIMEFIERTKIPLYQPSELRTKDYWKAVIPVRDGNEIKSYGITVQTCQGKIVCFRMGIYRPEDSEIKPFIDAEDFPYTIAGFSPVREISSLESPLLDDMGKESFGSNRAYYTSLELAKKGIEYLYLVGGCDDAPQIEAYVDLSLRENAQDLEYIWGERLCQSERGSDGKTVFSADPYTEVPEYYSQLDDIGKTVVQIKYPCIEIPGRPEMTQNANDVILEAVRKLEDSIYEEIDKNVLVEADYEITCVTSRLISIVFRAKATGYGGKRVLQCCNINMGNNGEKAYLADVGITEKIVAWSCGFEGSSDAEAVETYLEAYDMNWDHYYVKPSEFVFLVETSHGNGFFASDWFKDYAWADWLADINGLADQE